MSWFRRVVLVLIVVMVLALADAAMIKLGLIWQRQASKGFHVNADLAVAVLCAVVLVVVLVFNRPLRLYWDIRDLTSGKEHGRKRAVEKLGRMRSEKAVPDLLELFQREPEGRYVARALVHIGRPVVSGLAGLLADSNPTVRKRAAQVLGEMGVEAQDAIRGLISRLEDDSVVVRESAVGALRKMGLEARRVVRAFIEALDEDQEDLRELAATILGQEDPAVPEPLQADRSR